MLCLGPKQLQNKRKKINSNKEMIILHNNQIQRKKVQLSLLKDKRKKHIFVLQIKTML